MKAHGLIAFVCLSGGVSAQVAVFEAAPNRRGCVVNVGGAVERPPELQGIQLLPIECIGRSRLTELLPDQTRRRTDVPSAARLLLPGEQGSLYKYRRDGSPNVFGYFLVDANGVARSVFELPGFGHSALDPFLSRVSVSASGSAFLTATDEDAGGDLWEIELATGTAVNRTSDVPAQEFEKNGLALLGSWGLGVSERGLFRFERAPLARATAVVVPGDPRWFGEDVVRSQDGSTVAFQAGDDSNEAFVFVCRRLGDAVQVSTTPADVTSAGYLPDHEAGPKMGLSTDGSWVAWKVTGRERECLVRETQTASRPPEIHVTDNAHFDYTLDDTGVIAFFDPDSLTMVVGLHNNNDIVRGDLYKIDLTRGSSTFDVTNLTGTSGIQDPPYDYGYLDTSYALYQLPGPSPAYLVHAYHVDEESVLWIDSTGRTVELLDEVETVDSIDVVGDYLVAGVKREKELGEPCEPIDLLQICCSAPEMTVTRLPGGCRLSRHVGSRTRNSFAAVLELENGEWLGRMQVPDPRGLTLSNSFLKYGPTTGISAQGDILASVQVGNARVTFAWSDLGTQTLRASPVECFILPGL